MAQPENKGEDINIEAIMQDIRRQILEKKAKTSPGGVPIVKIEGKRLSPELYEHLYQASLIYDQIQAPMFVSKISIPVFGPLVQKMRQKAHQLVIFYVNQVAASQIRVNQHLLRALSILAEEFEKADEQ